MRDSHARPSTTVSIVLQRDAEWLRSPPNRTVPLRELTSDNCAVRTSRKILIGSVLVVAALVGAGIALHFEQAAAAAHAPHSLRLPDGTVAHFRGDTTVTPAAGYPNPRDIHIDGDAYVQLPPGSEPWTVRTRLLVLTVQADSVFRVTAYAKMPGEQVEVVRGQMEARKSYPSPYTVPDELRGGDMVMINRDIDLMEKEHTNADDVRRWGEALIAETAAKTTS
jgi:hypothetical protein